MTKINKEGWEIKKLGEVISSAKNLRCGEGQYEVLSMTMHDGIVLQRDRFKKSLASEDKSNYKVVKRGQLVVGFPIDEGVLYIQKVIDEGIMSPAYNVWDITNTEIDKTFLELALHSPHAMSYYKNKLRGSTARRRTLPTSTLLALPIPLPPLPIQQRIVEELDEINAIISAKKLQLSKLDELAQSIFYNMFGDPVANEKGWEVKELGTLSELKNGLNFDKTTSGIKLRFLGVSEFQSNRTLSSKAMPFIFVKEEPKEEFFLKDGDFVFVRSNGSKEMIGRSVLVSVDEYEKISFSGFCIRCRITSSDLDLKYVQYVVQHPSTRHLITHAGRGCNISNLNQKILSALQIPLPPLSLQEAFAARVSAIEEQKSSIAASIEKMQTLLDARMQEYFG